MSDWWHLVKHIFGWNTGSVVTFWLDDELYVGFKCDECGEIDKAHKCCVRRQGCVKKT